MRLRNLQLPKNKKLVTGVKFYTKDIQSNKVMEMVTKRRVNMHIKKPKTSDNSGFSTNRHYQPQPEAGNETKLSPRVMNQRNRTVNKAPERP